MRRAIAFCFAFWLLVGTAACASTGGFMLPPERYQGSGMAIIVTADQHEIASICAGKLRHHAEACADIGGPMGRVWIENPCHVANQHWYPALLCHEIAHVRGWDSDHSR